MPIQNPPVFPMVSIMTFEPSHSPYSLCIAMEEERDFRVEKVGPCVVITMDLGENRVNSNFIRAFHKALDQAERYTSLWDLAS